MRRVFYVRNRNSSLTDTMQTGTKLKKACAILIKLGGFAYGCVLILVLISHLALFDPNWPFGLFASFLSALIVMFPLVIAALFMVWRRAVPVISVLALATFWPFLTFDKMVKPSGGDCAQIDCITVVAANLRHSQDALKALSKTSAKDADVVVILDLHFTGTAEQLLTLFPMDGTAEVGLVTDPQLGLGSRIAVVSRKPVDAIELHIETPASTEVGPRGIVKFKYSKRAGAEVLVSVVHPPAPMSPEDTAARDAYLEAASEALGAAENFVMIGDFNLTPWEPGFKDLPGKRAGDPRRARTWNANNLVERITIDHAMIGGGIGLIESSVMEDVGSDHFPLRIVVKRKRDEGRSGDEAR